jgi:LmbE family N-acetylglucosaminyl deacetylase
VRVTLICPACEAVLNPREKLVFVVEHGGRRAIMLLSPFPGDYTSICEPTFAAQVQPGDQVTFFCPTCHADLSAPGSDRFAEILQLREGQEPLRARFSQVFGEHATFTINGEEIRAYGEHAELFRNLNFSETDSWW